MSNKNMTKTAKHVKLDNQMVGQAKGTESKRIKRKPHVNYKFISMDMRVNVIYDSLIHGI